MVKPTCDRERERRIATEIVVDTYDTHERGMGWYYYLQEQLKVPFTATCTAKRAISPLRVKDEVQVLGMPSGDPAAGRDRPDGGADRGAGAADGPNE